MLNKRLVKTRKPIPEFTPQLLELTQSTSLEHAKELGQQCKDKVQECARGMLLSSFYCHNVMSYLSSSAYAC